MKTRSRSFIFLSLENSGLTGESMKFLFLVLLIGTASGKQTSQEITVFNCFSAAPKMLGEELAHIELIIDFNLTQKKCWNDLGSVTKISNTEIVCDTSAKISNLKGFILNRFSGDLFSITKDPRGKERYESFRCKRIRRKI